ncbi:hypothetical protein C0J52_00193 [Blattella germanica]|nr:hypothetical protein C0J52_00193 [Blattella germanica]
MFTKQDQRSWLKIECARGRYARQCYEILQDVCGENALPYRTVARWVKAFNEGRQVLYHPPYSPDLSPCDYDLFPKMKEPLRGRRFRTVEDVLQATDRSIRTIQRLGTANGIQRLPHRWERVIHNAGGYIEGL